MFSFTLLEHVTSPLLWMETWTVQNCEFQDEKSKITSTPDLSQFTETLEHKRDSPFLAASL